MHPSFPAAALVLATLASAQAATEVCGTLRLAAEWTAKDSPYLVTGDIFIPNNSRLRIGPGVVVRFAKPGPCPDEKGHPPPLQDWSDSTYSGIKVEGTFYCLGTEEQPVIFEPVEAPRGASAGWDGLRISGQGPNTVEISFAVFRGANQAIFGEKSQFFIHHCLFQGNNTGIRLERRGDVTVLNCNFLGNRSAGIYVSKSNPRIANNIFADNLSYGIWADGRANIQVGHNAFWGNRDEHCFRCPFPVLQPAKVNANKDSCDRFGNLYADPVFLDSPSDRVARLADLQADTPPHLVKDAKLARLEAESRAKWIKAKAAFRPQGAGPFRLSPYSKLINAGFPGPDFKDRDGSPNDIGLHGGPLGRMTRSPF
jgi:parallel beta-helix repeat protein